MPHVTLVATAALVLVLLEWMPVASIVRIEPAVHEVAIVLAVLLSVGLAGLAIRSFLVHGSVEPLGAAAGLLAFSALYVWHGVFTGASPAFSFLIYGPMARVAFWLGLALMLVPGPIAAAARIRWVAGLGAVAVLLAVTGFAIHPILQRIGTDLSAAGIHSTRLAIESTGLVLGIGFTTYYVVHQARPLGRYQAWASAGLVLLALQSTYFLFTSAWTATWWAAHALGAGSTLLFTVAILVFIQTRREEAEMNRLRQLNALKTRFINAAAHELGTPLTPIRIQLAMLQADPGPLSEKQRKGLAVIERNVDRLLELTAKILEGARTEAGQIAIEAKPADLSQILHESVESYRPWCTEQGIRLHLDAPKQVEMTVDPRRLQQIISNFLSNAIKHTPSGGQVHVRAIPHGDNVAIHVNDTGRGLTKDQQRALFQPFAQFGGPDAPEGTGLGLYITKHLARRMGGSVAVRSEGLGKGSTFTVELPRTAPRGSGPTTF